MKKILAIAVLLLAMASCGVGTYSVESGKSEQASVSFVAQKSYPVTVTIDGKAYEVKTAKLKDWRTDRRIKQTAQNTIKIEPGKHEIIVTSDGEEVLKETVFLSNNESRIIGL